MDVREYSEGQNVTVELVKASATKKALIIDEGGVNEYEGKKKLRFTVNMDGKMKFWIPNKNTLKNIQLAWGWESSAWVGKTVEFRIEWMKGRESVIGVPTQL